ncbi:hypothetical protein EDB89DRAFT_1852892 [Lactarius sanguifluus]|nr:hypothetical protein EDB89DRAFT_1852892 [Lactarius sanguifluus]
MLKVARKYGTSLAAIRLSPDLRARLPAWYHLESKPRPLTSRQSKCLLKKHKIGTVADLVKTSARLRDHAQSIPHTPSPLCDCEACILDRINGCEHPHKCALEALARVHDIIPKLNPLNPGDPHDNLSLTRHRKKRNATAREKNEEILFDPSITCKNDLTECFRIFTDPDRTSPIPARRLYAVGLNLTHQKITIYTDGACFNNGKENARCGSGVWINPEDPRNEAIRVPGSKQSNQVGEVAAVIAAINKIPNFWPILVKTDSMYSGVQKYCTTRANKSHVPPFFENSVNAACIRSNW